MKLSYRNQRNAEITAVYWKKPLNKPEWFSISGQASDNPEIFIYDVIGWPYNDVGELVRTLAGMKDKTPLARINSPGGDVFDGMALLNAFMNHPGGVNIRIESLAASMASVLAMGGKKVEAYQNTMMMIHNSWVCAAGNRIELLEVADILEKVDGNILSTYTGKTKIGKREMADMMAAETWMNAKEMKEKGFIDTILESGKAVKAEFDLSVFANCPDGLRGENHEATEREKERVLRDVVGLSVKEAKAFLAGRRGGEGIDELAAELKKILSIFGG